MPVYTLPKKGDMGRFNSLMNKKYELKDRETAADEMRAKATASQAETAQFSADTDRQRLPFEETRSNAALINANANKFNVEQQGSLVDKEWGYRGDEKEKDRDATAWQNSYEREHEKELQEMKRRQMLEYAEAGKTPAKDQIFKIDLPSAQGLGENGQGIYNATKGQWVHNPTQQAQTQEEPTSIDTRKRDMESYRAMQKDQAASTQPKNQVELDPKKKKQTPGLNADAMRIGVSY